MNEPNNQPAIVIRLVCSWGQWHVKANRFGYDETLASGSDIQQVMQQASQMIGRELAIVVGVVP